MIAIDDAFVQHFLAYIKPFNSELADNDPNNFYSEREWRKFGNLLFQPGVDVIQNLEIRFTQPGALNHPFELRSP